MFTGQIIASTNFQYFTIFTLIGAMYLGRLLVASLGVRALERRLAVHVERRGVRTPNPPTVPDADHI
jgi:polar amino acid transport system permease protein